MKEIDKINLFIQYLITTRRFESQEELGKYLGYSNKSSFSQLLKKDISSVFREKFIKAFPEFLNFHIGYIQDNKEKKDSDNNISSFTSSQIVTKSLISDEENLVKFYENQSNAFAALLLSNKTQDRNIEIVSDRVEEQGLLIKKQADELEQIKKTVLEILKIAKS